MALMAEHDDAREASRHCARACGALTRVRRACLSRAQRAVPTSTDPMGILKSTREFKAAGAGKEHTSAVRGGGRDAGRVFLKFSRDPPFFFLIYLDDI